MALNAVIDRIEGEMAVLEFENGESLAVPLGALPEGAGKGVLLHVTFEVDEGGTRRREETIRDLHRDVFGEGNG